MGGERNHLKYTHRLSVEEIKETKAEMGSPQGPDLL